MEALSLIILNIINYFLYCCVIVLILLCYCLLLKRKYKIAKKGSLQTTYNYIYQMEQFTYEEHKAVAAVLLILNELTKVDKHKLAKILFFADQKHLARYGRPITADSYCKMEYGPIPSNILNSVNGVEKVHDFYKYHGFEGQIEVNGKFITPLVSADLDQLSESDKECLSESVRENAHLPFRNLTNKSHGSAWNSVGDCQTIPFTEIAKEGNASEFVMELIKMNLEAEELLSV